MTPLQLGYHKGHLHIVEFIIEKRAHTEAKDNFQHTLLDYASMFGKTNVVKYIIFKGANPL